MKTQKQDALAWWNSLTRNKRDELALDYYATPLIIDDEIVHIYLSEVAQEKTYTEEELLNLCENAYDSGRYSIINKDTDETFDKWVKQNL
jgi:hypothetical protein